LDALLLDVLHLAHIIAWDARQFNVGNLVFGEVVAWAASASFVASVTES
jgi:hypothetical protein